MTEELLVPNRWHFDQVGELCRARRTGQIGEVLIGFEWPATLPQVSSPWLSWENLECSGGWIPTGPDGQPIDGLADLELVIAGRKPLGGGDWQLDAPCDDPVIGDCFDPSFRMLALGQVARSVPGLLVEESHEPRPIGHFVGHVWHSVLIARDATFGELFDLVAIGAAYEKAGLSLTAQIIDLATRPIQSAWPSAATPENDLEVIAGGLALGYPLGSTLAFLTRWHKRTGKS